MLADLYASSSGITADGNRAYWDRTCSIAPAHVTEGKTYTLTLISNHAAQFNRAWIDYNYNGVFEAGEVVLETDSMYLKDKPQTVSFTIPYGKVKLNTALRMRVVCGVINFPVETFASCGELYSAQTEDYSVIIQPGPTTIEQLTKNSAEVKVYPNPAENLMHIEAETEVNTALYSIEGKMVMKVKGQKKLDISSLSPGLYLLKITDATSGAIIYYSKLEKQGK